MVTKLIRKTIVAMHERENVPIKDIARCFGLPERSVRAIIFKRVTTKYCLNCGKELTIIEGHRPREFCSKECYSEWRKKNSSCPTAVHICQYCGKTFIDPYHVDAKYCSRECYSKARLAKKTR